jgi:hypothetical protein
VSVEVIASTQPVLRTIVAKRAIEHRVDCSDDVLDVVFAATPKPPTGRVGRGAGGRRLRSWGHDADGVHFLAVQGGTALHNDVAYTRYSHQLVLRNDGTRIRGEPDAAPDNWHVPMKVGTLYWLDTHQLHQGLIDPRMAPTAKVPRKCVIAVDRDEPLPLDQAWGLLSRYLGFQLLDFPVNARPPRWRQS